MSEAAPDSRPVFRPAVAFALVLVGVFAFAAFMTLLAFTPDLARTSFCRSNAYSPCAVGYQGLTELVREQGAPMLISRTPLPKGRADGLLIVTPEPLMPSDIAGLGYAGPVLVVLPKWLIARDAFHPAWGLKAGLIDPKMMPNTDVLDAVTVARKTGVARHTLTGAAGTALAGVTLTPGPIDRLQTLSAKDWVPVLTDETGAAVIAQMPSTQIYVLAEPDLVNTQGLGDINTLGSAVTLLRAMRVGDGPVIFDVTLNGYKLERSLLQQMFKPPFLAVTLCVAAAMALAGLQTAFRFGPVRRRRRAIALGKEALTDNSAQLIQLAGREAKMAPRYAAFTRKEAARAVGAPRQLAGDALTAFLDRLAKQRGLTDTLADLDAEAARVQNRTGLGGRAGLTALSQRLYRWRLEMTRERQ